MLNVYFRVLDDVTFPILSELRKMRYKTIKYWLNTTDIDVLKMGMRDMQAINHQSIDHGLVCFNWDIKLCAVTPMYDGLEHLISRYTTESTDFVCVDSCNHLNDELVLFQDAKHKTDYPKEFIRIPGFSKYEALIEYANVKGAFPFSLSDTIRFEKCTGIDEIQGASVYKEIKTGRYWYKDMFHKTHYEVFNSTGKKHLGEADMDGNLDENKKDTSKSAIL